MEKRILTSALSFIFSFLFGQSPLIESQLFLNGNTYRNVPVKVMGTNDNGYVVLTSIDQTGYQFVADCKIVKFGADGSISWQKTIGGTSNDEASDIVQTSDGGYIMIGSTQSNNRDVFGNHNANVGNAPDVWVVKLTNLGAIEWQKCLGSVSTDYGRSIKQTIDGGYVIAASAGSNDGDVNGLHSPATSDYWIVKLTASGTIEWQKCLGGTSSDEAREIIQTSDGGYLIAGEAYSNNGDVTLNHGLSDFWIVKTDNVGTIEWQKSFGGSDHEVLKSVVQTTDGSYIVGGGTYQNSGTFALGGAWRFLKLDSSGNIIWNKSLSGQLATSFSQMKINPIDNHIFIIGNDYSYANSYNTNIEIDHLDPDGNFLKKNVFGGSALDYGVSLAFLTTNDLVILGDVRSTDGDITVPPSYNGNFEHTWFAKLSQRVLAVEEVSNIDKISLFPNPVKDFLYINSEEFAISQITIYDIAGKLISGSLEYYNGINLSFLNSGIYLIDIKNANGEILRRKIVKE